MGVFLQPDSSSTLQVKHKALIQTILVYSVDLITFSHNLKESKGRKTEVVFTSCSHNERLPRFLI